LFVPRKSQNAGSGIARQEDFGNKLSVPLFCRQTERSFTCLATQSDVLRVTVDTRKSQIRGSVISDGKARRRRVSSGVEFAATVVMLGIPSR